jgi:hypothetical protein
VRVEGKRVRPRERIERKGGELMLMREMEGEKMTKKLWFSFI